MSESPLSDDDSRRLWVGNLDTRITEFALLKLLQKYGELEKFDFLLHKTGPDAGKPRGYCFVTYQRLQDTEFALKSLNGKLALGKRIIVRPAHKEEESIPYKEGKGSEDKNEKPVSLDSKIRAIEMKLNHMDKTQQEFVISTKPSVTPGTSMYSSAQSGLQGTRPGIAARPGTSRYSSTSQPGTSKFHHSKPYGKKVNR